MKRLLYTVLIFLIIGVNLKYFWIYLPSTIPPLLFSLGISVANYSGFKVSVIKGVLMNLLFVIITFIIALLIPFVIETYIGRFSAMLSVALAVGTLFLLYTLIFNINRKYLGLLIVLTSVILVPLLSEVVLSSLNNQINIITISNNYFALWFSVIGIGFGVALNLNEKTTTNNEKKDIGLTNQIDSTPIN